MWRRLGNPDSFIEPFFGSGAVLLLRPHRPGVETANDADRQVANFWRSVKHDPGAVVEHCDWPVDETTIHANHRWLLLSDDAALFHKRMLEDPDYYDPKVAGRWVHGLCAWIGAGWCQSRADKMPTVREAGVAGGAANAEGFKRPLLAGPAGGSPGVHAANQEGFARPSLNKAAGHGVHGSLGTQGEPLPRISDPGNGIHAGGPVPHMSSPGHGMDAVAGQGLNVVPSQARPQLADAFDIGRGVHRSGPGEDLFRGTQGACAARRAFLMDWFQKLSDRFRQVRVCAGHWLRVCSSESTTVRLGTTGLFLDPPYPTHRALMPTGKVKARRSRAGKLYSGADEGKALDALRDEILSYCKEWGKRKAMRIALCGYEGDGYEPLLEDGWKVEAWTAGGGYANQNKAGNVNRGRERVFFSPFCAFESTLFELDGGGHVG